MACFVTGRTGFIGRNLVERLLDREGEIHLLHRPGSAEKVEKASTEAVALAHLTRGVHW